MSAKLSPGADKPGKLPAGAGKPGKPPVRAGKHLAVSAAAPRLSCAGLAGLNANDSTCCRRSSTATRMLLSCCCPSLSSSTRSATRSSATIARLSASAMRSSSASTRAPTVPGAMSSSNGTVSAGWVMPADRVAMALRNSVARALRSRSSATFVGMIGGRRGERMLERLL